MNMFHSITASRLACRERHLCINQSDFEQAVAKLRERRTIADTAPMIWSLQPDRKSVLNRQGLWPASIATAIGAQPGLQLAMEALITRSLRKIARASFLVSGLAPRLRKSWNL